MSNFDILGKADRALRPVLKELEKYPWIRLEGCCAGHKPEDSLWLELNIQGSSGLRHLSELLRILDSKLTATDCRLDCLLSYSAPADMPPPPHGWIPVAVEVFWPSKTEWRRAQSMVIETLLSSLEEFGDRATETPNPACGINFCPFCSSSFIRLDTIEKSGPHRYRCGDCDMTWTMVDPAV